MCAVKSQTSNNYLVVRSLMSSKGHGILCAACSFGSFRASECTSCSRDPANMQRTARKAFSSREKICESAFRPVVMSALSTVRRKQTQCWCLIGLGCLYLCFEVSFSRMSGGWRWSCIFTPTLHPSSEYERTTTKFQCVFSVLVYEIYSSLPCGESMLCPVPRVPWLSQRVSQPTLLGVLPFHPEWTVVMQTNTFWSKCRGLLINLQWGLGRWAVALCDSIEVTWLKDLRTESSAANSSLWLNNDSAFWHYSTRTSFGKNNNWKINCHTLDTVGL